MFFLFIESVLICLFVIKKDGNKFHSRLIVLIEYLLKVDFKGFEPATFDLNIFFVHKYCLFK